jgi:hypothetical protein
MASKMEFLYSKDAFKFYLQSKLLGAPKRQKDIIMKRDDLNAMLLNEDTMYVNVLASECKEKKAEPATHGFPKVFLLSDEDFDWLYATDWKEGDAMEYTWHTLTLHFYFPKKHIIQRVHMESCIGAFPKAQRMNIFSHLKEKLKKKGYVLTDMRIPSMFKNASTLVGAGINDATHAQLADAYRNKVRYVNGWIYSEEGYQRIVADFEAEMGNRPASGIFFPD